MIKRYKYRAYLTGEQQHAASRLFGTCRAVWNMSLYQNQTHYTETGRKLTSQELNEWVKQLKTTPEYAWIKDVSSVPVQQVLRDLDKAYSNFFNSMSGKRKGTKVGAPRYKKKQSRQSARFTNNAGYKVTETTHGVGFVTLPKIGKVKFVLSRALPSAPSSVTLIKEADGSYYVSFVVEAQSRERLVPVKRNAGVDLGLKDLACIIYDDGTRERVENPRWERKRQVKVTRAQRSLSRKGRGSRNYEKARVELAKQYKKSRDARLDHHHKLAYRLVLENQGIAMEDLCVKGLARTRLARSIHDAGWSELTRLMKEKAEEFGSVVHRVDRWEPTSQKCCLCGYSWGRLGLGVRVVGCLGCGVVLDRDFNAAVNVLVAAGLAETLNACGGSVRLRLAEADPVKQEPTELPVLG